jgi:hypothetical protein
MRQQTEDTREELRDLRRRLVWAERPRVYPTMNGARAAHVIVPLVAGTGHDPEALAHALKVFKRTLQESGAASLMRADSPLYIALPRSQKARRKARLAARRRAKTARRAARREGLEVIRGA